MVSGTWQGLQKCQWEEGREGGRVGGRKISPYNQITKRIHRYQIWIQLCQSNISKSKQYVTQNFGARCDLEFMIFQI